ncbi:MAG: hypothetical protein KIS92_01655 [Planctomycetota bacterium]|nr:hypothetical protein [Planctomycetota bacterium]
MSPPPVNSVAIGSTAPEMVEYPDHRPELRMGRPQIHLSALILWTFAAALFLMANLRVTVKGCWNPRPFTSQVAMYERGFPFTIQYVERYAGVPVKFGDQLLTEYIQTGNYELLFHKGFPGREIWQDEMEKLLERPSLNEEHFPWKIRYALLNFLIFFLCPLLVSYSISFLRRRFSRRGASSESSGGRA